MGNNGKLRRVPKGTAGESQACVTKAKLKCDLGRFVEKTGRMNRKLQVFCFVYSLILLNL